MAKTAAIAKPAKTDETAKMAKIAAIAEMTKIDEIVEIAKMAKTGLGRANSDNPLKLFKNRDQGKAFSSLGIFSPPSIRRVLQPKIFILIV